MRKTLLILFFFIQTSLVFSQTLEYLNFMHYPILDTSKYQYEYLRIITEENGVVHTQLINRDTVKILHSTALLNEQGEKKSERILRYFPNGNMEYNKRIDFEKDQAAEKYFYETGELKSEILIESQNIVSEVYYAKNGDKIPKPVIEDPSPKNGINGWNSYLASELRYPPEARAVRAMGMVLISFDLDEKGKITNIKAGNAEYVHEALWKEAVRVIEKYPHNWIPKKENGIPIPSEVKLPIRFKLS